MNITPNKLTIAQLFATNNEQFIVPSYQRRYAWGYNQVAALFDDINMLKDGDGHLFGMILLHTHTHVGGLNKPELVDGQQRLTTLTILLKALQKSFEEIGNRDRKNEIEKMLGCSGYDEVKLPKLLLGELDNEDLVHLLKNDENYEYTNRKIIDAYEYFLKWLEDLTKEELNRFYFKLTNVAVLIRLDVGMAQDAYKLFETINNRGLKLSPTDIIKNFLLGHAAKISPETLEETKELWSRIIINLDGIDSDDFFRQFMCALIQRKITKTTLVYEFKNYYFKHIDKADMLGEFEYYVDEPYEDESEEEIIFEANNESAEEIETSKKTITEFLSELKNLSKVYRKIALEEFEEVKINRHVSYLNRILSKPTYIFLMHFLQRDFSINLKVEVLKMLEAFMLRRHICEMRTSEHDDIFSKMIPVLEMENIVTEIKEHLEEFFPEDDDFYISFPKHKFKGKLADRAKYVLEKIEYFENGDTGELLVSSGSEVELEHIIPQTINTKRAKNEFGDWEEYLGERSSVKHKKFVDLIGNMTLLADRLNIQASNNPFAKKKESYRNSSLSITKILGEKSDFKFDDIEKRGENLAEKAVEIWKI